MLVPKHNTCDEQQQQIARYANFCSPQVYLCDTHDDEENDGREETWWQRTTVKFLYSAYIQNWQQEQQQ